MHLKGIMLATAALLPLPAAAQEGTFTLGQIIVTASRPEDPAITSERLSADAIYRFERNSLDDAVNLTPGVSAGNSGGSRNERLIFVRGFDRFQVPLTIDGIRVYLPADNRLDYGRFLTADIAEVQVAKGYASVLDGPGALGGAVNLVTRKPARAIEAEARGSLTLDSDADYAGYNAFALLGTAQEKWYAQASYNRNVTDHWDLPGGYEPVPGSAEDGGARDFSRTRDWRVNVKLGFTPNDTDEYSISYTRQEGSRNAPLHITDPVANQRNWSWPYWNIESIYFLSTTALGDKATLKTRIYRNSFDNLLTSFDDATQTTQSLPRAFDSYYNDKAYGGSVQLDVDLTAAYRFSLAAHYRRDKHVEQQDGFVRRTNPAPPVILAYSEPDQTNLEDTYSVAAENRLILSPALTLNVGVSYDWRDLKRAEDYVDAGLPTAAYVFYPLRNADAINWQGKLSWTPDADTSIHASVSRRSRFPTVFERFSTRFGTAASNPDLKEERATNVEIGGARRFGAIRLEAAVFYSHIDDAIVSVRMLLTSANTDRRENLGSAEYYGGEIGLTASVAPTLDIGANYTYIHRSFDIATPPADTVAPLFRLTDVPTHKGFAYVNWRPFDGLEITPSVDVASNRTVVTAQTSSSLTPTYYRTGSYAVANLRISYALNDRIEIGVGARNLFDEYYVLTDGFPERGRSFFLSARARY